MAEKISDISMSEHAPQPEGWWSDVAMYNVPGHAPISEKDIARYRRCATREDGSIAAAIENSFDVRVRKGKRMIRGAFDQERMSRAFLEKDVVAQTIYAPSIAWLETSHPEKYTQYRQALEGHIREALRGNREDAYRSMQLLPYASPHCFPECIALGLRHSDERVRNAAFQNIALLDFSQEGVGLMFLALTMDDVSLERRCANAILRAGDTRDLDKIPPSVLVRFITIGLAKPDRDVRGRFAQCIRLAPEADAAALRQGLLQRTLHAF